MEHDSKQVKVILHCHNPNFFTEHRKNTYGISEINGRSCYRADATTTILSREILMTRQVQRLHNTIYHRVTYDQLSPLYEEKRHAAWRRRERALLIVSHVSMLKNKNAVNTGEPLCNEWAWINRATRDRAWRRPTLGVYGFQLWSSQRRNVVLFSEW